MEHRGEREHDIGWARLREHRRTLVSSQASLVLAWLIVIPPTLWALTRSFGVERGHPGWPLIALTPHVALTTRDHLGAAARAAECGVLIDDRLGAVDYDVKPQQGSDHDAVLGTIQLAPARRGGGGNRR